MNLLLLESWVLLESEMVLELQCSTRSFTLAVESFKDLQGFRIFRAEHQLPGACHMTCLHFDEG